jgi:hypothetical protein
MKRHILSPDPLFVVDFVSERNTDCISERTKYATDEGDAEGFGDFMNNPG